MSGATEDFSADWLALREPADLAARNHNVLARCLDFLAERDRTPTIVDLGCGTGSTLRALAGGIATRLPEREQRWVLVDRDRRLLDRARQETQDFLLKHGLAGVTVEYKALDVSDPESLNGLFADCDLVTGSALIDLVSAEWLDALCALAVKARPGLYFALNYSGAESWLPPHPLDAAVLAAFNRDQRRDKGFGPALGSAATAHLEADLRRAGFSVMTGESDWKISACPLIEALAEGIVEAAAREGGVSRPEALSWLDARRRSQSAVIGHLDLFAAPGGS